MTDMMIKRSKQVNPWYGMDQDIPRKPVVRISNEDEMVVLTAELPGFSAEDLDIQIKENLLTVQALRKEIISEDEKEREETKVIFEKSFILPDELNREKIEAEMKHGLLTLNLPRKEKEAAISIKVK